MTEAVQELLSRNGFAFIGAHAPELSSWEAASQFGAALRIPGFSCVQVLEPRRKEIAPPNTYSGTFGHGDFPLHTDLAHWCVPPRYVVLRCVAGTDSVVTRVLDGNCVLEAVGRTALSRSLVQPRRPLGNCRTLLRLLDRRDRTSEFMRWDRLFIVPATPLSAAMFNVMGEYLDSAKTVDISLSKPGDTLLIDNWRALHGRSAIGPAATDRRIDRIYFDELN